MILALLSALATCIYKLHHLYGQMYMYTLQWVTMYRKGRLSVRRKNETRKRTSQLGRTDETTGPSQLARTDDATESLTVSIQRSLWASAPVASATTLGRRLALASFLPLGQNNNNNMF